MSPPVDHLGIVGDVAVLFGFISIVLALVLAAQELGAARWRRRSNVVQLSRARARRRGPPAPS